MYQDASPPAPQVVFPPSPEMRGRRLGSELALAEELADLRLRSRSRGRSDAALVDRADWAAWEIAQKEAEQARVIADYEAKKAAEAAARKKAEEELRLRIEREKIEAKEKAEREWKEFLQKQKEQKEEDERKKKAKEAEIQEEMAKRLAEAGFRNREIKALVEPKKVETTVIGSTTGSTSLTIIGNNTPKFSKVHGNHVSVDTLRYYDIPWEYDRVSDGRSLWAVTCLLTCVFRSGKPRVHHHPARAGQIRDRRAVRAYETTAVTAAEVAD